MMWTIPKKIIIRRKIQINYEILKINIYNEPLLYINLWDIVYTPKQTGYVYHMGYIYKKSFTFVALTKLKVMRVGNQ